MKRKIVILVAILVTLVGCAINNASTAPKRVVEDLLGKYQSLDSKVLDQLDDVIADENLTDAQKGEYEELMRKQYQNLTYTIKDEAIDGDKAVVTTEIEVYDYGKANKATDDYVADHQSEFLGDDNKFSDALYEDYKLDKLKAVTDRVKYTLDLGLTKSGNDWKLDDLSDAERQKIHGLYSV